MTNKLLIVEVKTTEELTRHLPIIRQMIIEGLKCANYPTRWDLEENAEVIRKFGVEEEL